MLCFLYQTCHSCARLPIVSSINVQNYSRPRTRSTPTSWPRTRLPRPRSSKSRCTPFDAPRLKIDPHTGCNFGSGVGGSGKESVRASALRCVGVDLPAFPRHPVAFGVCDDFCCFVSCGFCEARLGSCRTDYKMKAWEEVAVRRERGDGVVGKALGDAAVRCAGLTVYDLLFFVVAVLFPLLSCLS